MYSYKKIWLLDSAGPRPYSIAQLSSEAQDNNGKNYDLFYIYIPKELAALSAAAAPWTSATTPASVDTPPGYFN
jgi:hypothetical protein